VVDALGGPKPGQILMLPLEGRQLQAVEVVGKQDLGCFGPHAASPFPDGRRPIYAFADVVSTVALGT